MSYPQALEVISRKTADDLDRELRFARTRFPGTAHLLAALVEEVGELAKALLEGDEPEVRAEALQVACVAIRILEEGDADFGIGPIQDRRVTTPAALRNWHPEVNPAFTNAMQRKLREANILDGETLCPLEATA